MCQCGTESFEARDGRAVALPDGLPPAGCFSAWQCLEGLRLAVRLLNFFSFSHSLRNSDTCVDTTLA